MEKLGYIQKEETMKYLGWDNWDDLGKLLN